MDVPGLSQISLAIDDTEPSSATRLIAIDGLGGSGKSTLVTALRELRPEFKVLPVDAFACTASEYPLHPLGCQTRISLERLLRDALLPLREGHETRFTRTPWWPGETVEEICVQPGGTVLVEGCYTLHRVVRSHFDLKFWVEVPPESAIERAILRDGETGRDAWEQAHHPNELSYLATHQPDIAADLIIENPDGAGFRVRRR